MIPNLQEEVQKNFKLEGSEEEFLLVEMMIFRVNVCKKGLKSSLELVLLIQSFLICQLRKISTAINCYNTTAEFQVSAFMEQPIYHSLLGATH